MKDINIELLETFLSLNLQLKRKSGLRDIPKKYLCRLSDVLLLDAVKLPGGEICDRGTIMRHIKGTGKNPFDRKPLTENQLVPISIKDPNHEVNEFLNDKIKQLRENCADKLQAVPCCDHTGNAYDELELSLKSLPENRREKILEDWQKKGYIFGPNGFIKTYHHLSRLLTLLPENRREKILEDWQEKGYIFGPNGVINNGHRLLSLLESLPKNHHEKILEDWQEKGYIFGPNGVIKSSWDLGQLLTLLPEDRREKILEDWQKKGYIFGQTGVIKSGYDLPWLLQAVESLECLKSQPEGKVNQIVLTEKEKSSIARRKRLNDWMSQKVLTLFGTGGIIIDGENLAFFLLQTFSEGDRKELLDLWVENNMIFGKEGVIKSMDDLRYLLTKLFSRNEYNTVLDQWEKKGLNISELVNENKVKNLNSLLERIPQDKQGVVLARWHSMLYSKSFGVGESRCYFDTNLDAHEVIYKLDTACDRIAFSKFIHERKGTETQSNSGQHEQDDCDKKLVMDAKERAHIKLLSFFQDPPVNNAKQPNNAEQPTSFDNISIHPGLERQVVVGDGNCLSQALRASIKLPLMPPDKPKTNVIESGFFAPPGKKVAWVIPGLPQQDCPTIIDFIKEFGREVFVIEPSGTIVNWATLMKSASNQPVLNQKEPVFVYLNNGHYDALILREKYNGQKVLNELLTVTQNVQRLS